MHDQSDYMLLPCAQAPAASASAVLPEMHRFTFTGSGKEYFRIWVVNLFLTIATLGVYSAWAKVRRLQYFDRNTHLAGAVFDFRGDPKAILKGRVLALCLLGAHHYAFAFGIAAGLAMVALLLLALPFLLRGALRFRLRSTVYRGLRGDFTGALGAAYCAYLPPLLTLLLPGALLAIDPSGKSALCALSLNLGWPLMHGAMKRYQQRHLQFGAVGASYDLPARRFFPPYLVAALAGMAGLSVVLGMALLVAAKSAARLHGGMPLSLLTILVASLSAYLCYLLAGPYLQARIANLVWSNTAFPGVAIRSSMSARALLRLQSVNALLTLATLGLYRPFAVVRTHQYRLAHLSLHSAASFEQVAGGARRRSNAAGDGVADFLGVELAW